MYWHETRMQNSASDFVKGFKKAWCCCIERDTNESRRRHEGVIKDTRRSHHGATNESQTSHGGVCGMRVMFECVSLCGGVQEGLMCTHRTWHEEVTKESWRSQWNACRVWMCQSMWRGSKRPYVHASHMARRSDEKVTKESWRSQWIACNVWMCQSMWRGPRRPDVLVSNVTRRSHEGVTRKEAYMHMYICIYIYIYAYMCVYI